MTAEELLSSIDQPAPPDGLDVPLRGLWHAARGEWDEAHVLVQDDPSPDAAWVHAHLHRVEGDLSNAGYWYGRAGRRMPSESIEQERATIAEALLAEADGD